MSLYLDINIILLACMTTMNYDLLLEFASQGHHFIEFTVTETKFYGHFDDLSQHLNIFFILF